MVPGDSTARQGRSNVTIAGRLWLVGAILFMAIVVARIVWSSGMRWIVKQAAPNGVTGNASRPVWPT